MLIIVPPSETKAAPAASGPPVNLEALSFPELLPMRRRVTRALIETSAHLDAFERLRLKPSFAADVTRNIGLFEIPAMPVLELYTGPLHQGLDAAGLSPAAAARATRSLVITSPLWGLLRPTDRVPPYRLGAYVPLLGTGRVDHLWRQVLPAALAGAAGSDGVIVDLRSAPTRSSGMPAGLGHRTVVVKVDQGSRGSRIGDVVAKRVRGEAAHELLEADEDPADPHALASMLARRWAVGLSEPDTGAGPWMMTLSID